MVKIVGPLELSLHWVVGIAHGGFTHFYYCDIIRQRHTAAPIAGALNFHG